MAIRGWVYVIFNEAMPDLVKVGYSTKDPNLRAEELVIHFRLSPIRLRLTYWSPILMKLNRPCTGNLKMSMLVRSGLKYLSFGQFA
jgi:hypothetical protein